MSLPGLQLAAPVEPVINTSVYELPEASEWRFEVAFGSKVEIKVRLTESNLPWLGYQSADRNMRDIASVRDRGALRY